MLPVFQERVILTSRVAILEFNGNYAKAFSQTIQQINGINELNTSERSVVVKVGVFSHKVGNHTSVGLVKAIIESFDRTPKVFLSESDNYQGTALERLQIWKELFTEKVTPANLSDEENTRKVTLAGQEMNLSTRSSSPTY
jgi:hypothetical protein